MGRLLAIAVFAIAAGSAALAGAGLAVAPHVDPPGTPTLHRDHVLAAYRYPTFLIYLASHLDGRPHFAIANAQLGAAAALVLATLVALSPRLSRPSRRPLWIVRAPTLAVGMRRSPPLLGPPRARTLLLAT